MAMACKESVGQKSLVGKNILKNIIKDWALVSDLSRQSVVG